MMMNFTVPDLQTSPLLLRNFLRSQGVSLTQWRKAKTGGTIYVNGQPATPSTFLKAGDQITIASSTENHIIPTNIPLSIMYEDDYILIVDKPAGLLIHPTKDNLANSLANAVTYYYISTNRELGFHPILRLDRNTSGLVLIAKQPYIQHLLTNRKETISKRYLALVSGRPASAEMTIDAPIARHPDSIIERMVASNGQKALTKYRVLQSYLTASLVDIELLTGRTHQIRVHFAHLGHPLLGDDLYGGPTELISRQALHAAELTFTHPVSHLAMHVSSPLPADLQAVLHVLAETKKKYRLD